MTRSQYLLELKQNLEFQLKDVSAEMLSACLKMIDYISIAPSKKNHLTFADLYKRVDSSTSEDIFYSAVFFLTKDNIDVLSQKFEAYNSLVSRFEIVEDADDVSGILDSITTGEYIHPLNGEVLTAEEFNQQVLTFFSPSILFVSNLNAH